MFDKRSHFVKAFALTAVLLTGSQFASVAQNQQSISLIDMARFYTGQPQQDGALRTLQRQIDNNYPELLQADSVVSNVWRNSPTLVGHDNILNQIPLQSRSGSDPVSVALAVAAPTVGAPLHVEVLPTEGGVESPSRVMVTVDRGGFSDDSVEGDRHRFDMLRQNEQWTIQRAGRQIRCQPGRGHQSFSTQPCI